MFSQETIELFLLVMVILILSILLWRCMKLGKKTSNIPSWWDLEKKDDNQD